MSQKNAQPQTELKIALVNIGPLKEARVELGRGLTVFYGPNASGKTTVARALRLLALMNTYLVEGWELMDVLYSRMNKEGRIVYESGGAVLEMKGTVKDNKMWVEFRGACNCSDHLNSPDDHLDVIIRRPRAAMFWIRHDAAAPYGTRGKMRPYRLEKLLAPSTIRGILGIDRKAPPEELLDFYEELLADVNKYLESFTGYALEYRGKLYFRRGAHHFSYRHTARGVRRMALIIAATLLARAAAEKAIPPPHIDEREPAIPVVYLEDFELSLHVDYLDHLIEFLRRRSVVAVAETHSGFVLRRAYETRDSGDVRYYVFKDGTVHTELNPSLFKEEIAATPGADKL